MPIVITCPSCQKSLQVPETASGKKVRCPACKDVFQVSPPPQVEEAIAPAAPQRAALRRGPPPVPSEDEDDDRPPRREPVDFTPLKFQAIIKTAPDKKLKGQYTAELGPEGLTLRRKKQPDINIAVGDRVRYLKNNRIEVEIDGRPVEMDLAQLGWYCKRLARDSVGFLRGKIDEMHKEDYVIPWYLVAGAFLPAGIPIITLGGAIPWGLAGGLIGANMAIGQIESISKMFRFVLIFLISLAGYLIIAALILLARGA